MPEARRATCACAIACLAVLLCSAAAPQPEAPAPPVPGRLRIAVAPYEPFAFQKNGEWVGFDIDLLKLVCTANGWTPEFVPATFSGALDAVERGDAATAAGACYVRPEPGRRILFTRPYLRSGLVMVTRADGPSAREARRIGFTVGSTGEAFARREFQDTEHSLVGFPTIEASFAALADGSVDAVVNGYMNSVRLVEDRYPGRLAIAHRFGGPWLMTRDELGFPVDPRLPGFKQLIDATLREFESGGTLDRLEAKWLHAAVPPDWGHIGLLAAGVLAAFVLVGGTIGSAAIARGRARTLEEYWRLLESLPGAVLVTGNDAILYANAAALALLDCGSRDDLSRLDADKSGLSAVFALGIPERPRAHALVTDRGTVEVDVSAVPVRFRGRDAVQWILRDVTELHRARRERAIAFEAQASLLRFQEQMLETAAAWVAVTDDTGRIVLWNRAAEKLSGVPRSEAVGTDAPWLELLGPEELPQFVDALQLAASSAPQREGMPFLVHARGGGDVAMSFFFSAMGIEETGDRVVIVGVDLTAERSLTEQLLQSQKLEAMGRLAAGVAHEFNNLLQVIMGFAEILAYDPEGSEREEPGQIVKASLHGAALARQLLAFGRRQPMQRAVLDIDDLVSDMRPLIAPLLGERVRLELTRGGAGAVLADRVALQQILLNLAANARDAMPGGGTFTIATRRDFLVEDQVRRVPGLTPGEWIVLSATDTGTGMPPETRERMFEPFFTTKELGRGTGLGLATVHGVVLQHGGAITVDSEPGAGTRFEIYLPFTDQRPRRPEPGPSPVHAEAKGLLVLVVEDDPSVREALAGGLPLLDYRVVAVASATEARELVLDERPAALLTDVQLGDGSGFDVARLLRERWPDLPVCYLTGYGTATALEDASASPNTAVLAKPCLLGELSETLRRLTAHQ